MTVKIIVAILFTAVFLTACQEPPMSEPEFSLESVPRTSGELIYNPDLFLSNFSSANTTVLGIRVGSTEREITNALGTPDHVDEFNFGAIRNLHYGRKFGVNGTAVLYHLEHGFVTRIVVTSAMNQFLEGTAAVNKTKADVYGVYGIPERQYDIPTGRFFVYNKQGFEVYLSKAEREQQYAFVYPNRKLATTAVFNRTKNQYEVLEYELPHLISDTTTLCDQGRTYGYSAARNECREFNSACDIPDHWAEVERCENATNVPRRPGNNATENRSEGAQ